MTRSTVDELLPLCHAGCGRWLGLTLAVLAACVTLATVLLWMAFSRSPPLPALRARRPARDRQQVFPQA
jgi:hypothetical protein